MEGGVGLVGTIFSAISGAIGELIRCKFTASGYDIRFDAVNIYDHNYAQSFSFIATNIFLSSLQRMCLLRQEGWGT